MKHHLIRVIPSGWNIEEKADEGVMYFNKDRGLLVIVSGDTERDGKRWIHFSASHRARIPTWEELVELKEIFLGPETLAIQVVPPRSQYVNFCAKALHLWVCLDGDPTPDFRRGDLI